MFPVKFNNTTIMILVAIVMVIILLILGWILHSKNNKIKDLHTQLNSLRTEKALAEAQVQNLVGVIENQNEKIDRIKVDYEKKLKHRKVITKEVLKVVYKDRNITVPPKECTELANHIDSIKAVGL